MGQSAGAPITCSRKGLGPLKGKEWMKQRKKQRNSAKIKRLCSALAKFVARCHIMLESWHGRNCRAMITSFAHLYASDIFWGKTELVIPNMIVIQIFTWPDLRLVDIISIGFFECSQTCLIRLWLIWLNTNPTTFCLEQICSLLNQLSSRICLCTCACLRTSYNKTFQSVHSWSKFNHFTGPSG